MFPRGEKDLVECCSLHSPCIYAGLFYLHRRPCHHVDVSALFHTCLRSVVFFPSDPLLVSARRTARERPRFFFFDGRDASFFSTAFRGVPVSAHRTTMRCKAIRVTHTTLAGSFFVLHRQSWAIDNQMGGCIDR